MVNMAFECYMASKAVESICKGMIAIGDAIIWRLRSPANIIRGHGAGAIEGGIDASTRFFMGNPEAFVFL